MNKKKTALIVLGVIILSMMLTNPKPSSFKEFSPDVSFKYKKWIYKRKSNWLIFSVYQKDLYVVDEYDGSVTVQESYKYVGILKNFFRI